MHHLKVTQSTIKTAITYSVCICKYCIKQNGAVKPAESVWNKINENLLLKFIEKTWAKVEKR